MTTMMRIIPRDMVLSRQALTGKLTPRRACWAKHIPAAADDEAYLGCNFSASELMQ